MSVELSPTFAGELLKVRGEILDRMTHRAVRSSINEIALELQSRLLAHELLQA